MKRRNRKSSKAADRRRKVRLTAYMLRQLVEGEGTEQYDSISVLVLSEEDQNDQLLRTRKEQ